MDKNLIILLLLLAKTSEQVDFITSIAEKELIKEGFLEVLDVDADSTVSYAITKKASELCEAEGIQFSSVDEEDLRGIDVTEDFRVLCLCYLNKLPTYDEEEKKFLSLLEGKAWVLTYSDVFLDSINYEGSYKSFTDVVKQVTLVGLETINSFFVSKSEVLSS